MTISFVGRGLCIWAAAAFALVGVSPAQMPNVIRWDSGDSGTIGSLKFRLKDVDSPEPGDIGDINGAKCEKERQLGLDAKRFMESLSAGKTPVIMRRYNVDDSGRLVVDLAIGGMDPGVAGMAAGHLKQWPFDGNKALTAKPDWCG